MNWRRGFWRAWITVSALWLLLVFSEEEVREPVETYWAFYSVQDSSLSPGPWDQYSHLLSDAEFLGVGTRLLTAEEIKERFCVGEVPADECDQAVRFQLEGQIREATRRFNEAQSQLLDVLSAAFLPPIGLLAFGLAVAWVLRGFRRTSA